MFLREKLFLQLIAYSEDKKQKFQIIKCINHNQYFELKKIAINILQGVLPLKKVQGYTRRYTYNQLQVRPDKSKI